MRLSEGHRRVLRIDEARLRLLPEDQEIRLEALEDGVLFIMAAWSCGSIRAFQALNQALDAIPDANRLVLMVADTDSARTEAFIRKQGDVPGGWGETYWIRNGVVMSRLAGYRDEALETVREYTSQILIRLTTTREAELLCQIHGKKRSGFQERFDELSVRRRDFTLTPEEHDELVRLVDESEAFAARRLEALAELAQLRQVPLPALMKQLGLKPPPVA